MDWHQLQHGADVHRALHRVSGRLDGTTANFVLCCNSVYGDLHPRSIHPQLQLAAGGDCAGGADLRHVLPAYPDVCPAQYSASVPPLHDRALRDIRRWSSEHRADALRLVQRPSFLALDVLEFGANHAGHDGLYLFRNTSEPGAEAIVRDPSLRRFSICQRGVRDAAWRFRTRGKAGLVALRCVHRTIRRRHISTLVRAGAETAKSQSLGGHALPSAVEHRVTWDWTVFVSLLSGNNDHPGPTVAGNPWV